PGRYKLTTAIRKDGLFLMRMRRATLRTVSDKNKNTISETNEKIRKYSAIYFCVTVIKINATSSAASTAVAAIYLAPGRPYAGTTRLRNRSAARTRQAFATGQITNIKLIKKP